MTSVDLHDAYYSIRIAEQHQKLLKFVWNDQIFQFVGMPNGLTSAPRTFTKLLTPVFPHLRSLGHACFPYIDDTFVVADSLEEATNSCRVLAETLDKLGFVIHEKKSVLIPTRKLTCLGFEIDSDTMTVKVTGDKISKFQRAVMGLKGPKNPTIRAVAGIIGLMTAYLPSTIYGGAHIKTLEIAKNKALKAHKGNFDARMSIPEEVWADMDWWVVSLPHATRPVQVIKPQLTIYTDASLQGWGAFCENNGLKPFSTGGRWREEEAQHHINVLELKAIFHGIRSIVPPEVSQIRVMTDNTTALAYIKNMGGVQSKECNAEAKLIWNYCEQNKLWLIPAHIAGKLNVQADSASHNFTDDVEWELSNKLWDKIVNKWGQPDIDMFASRINNKCDTFISWFPQPEAWLIDAFSIAWDIPNKCLYFFPPFSLVGRVLTNIIRYRCRAILILPDWQSQQWVALATKKATTFMLFRKHKSNLTPHGSPNNETQFGATPLMACLFSGTN